MKPATLQRSIISIFLVLFVFSGLSVRGQHTVSQDDFYKLVFVKNHLMLETGTNFWLPGNISDQSEGDMRWVVKPGFFLGVQYRLNLHRNVSISSGLRLGIQAMNLRYQTNVGEVLQLKMVKPSPSIPISLQTRLFTSPKGFFELGLGMEFFFMEKGKTLLVTDLEQGDQFHLNVEHSKFSPTINPMISLGYGLVLKNLDVVMLSIDYNKGIAQVVSASYQIKSNDFVKGTGTVFSRNDMLSIRFKYILTKAKHMRHNVEEYMDEL